MADSRRARYWPCHRRTADYIAQVAEHIVVDCT